MTTPKTAGRMCAAEDFAANREIAADCEYVAESDQIAWMQGYKQEWARRNSRRLHPKKMPKLIATPNCPYCNIRMQFAVDNRPRLTCSQCPFFYEMEIHRRTP